LAGAYANLGNAAKARKDYDAALGLARQAYEMRLEVFGPTHPWTAGSLTAIADNELALGRIEDAIGHYRAALAALLESVGPEYPAVVELRQTLAQLEPIQ
jgi:tetratricopeptide (TPR) repeat protein